MAFSPQALQTIEGFAANLGLPAMPSADGSYSFAFENSGTLTLTSAQDGERTLLSLFMRPHRLDWTVEQKIMSLAGPDITTNRFLSAGLLSDGVMFAVSVDDAEMSLPTLETCMQQLLKARANIE